MLIKQDFVVPQPIDKVWAFFQDVPQVAACLPGTDLTDDLGDDKYGGSVVIRMGPVKLAFDGKASIKERDDATHRMVIDAAGADQKGRGQASMLVHVGLTSLGGSARVDVGMDLQLSGAAAQYGRGMVSDVTAVLIRDFATNAQARIDAISKGLDPNAAAGAKPASGLSIGLTALKMALARVGRRFFLPYRPAPS